jgi:hypothetical protein
MYAKLNNGVVEKYPYTIGDLRKDNPNTSFPSQISQTTLDDFGVVTVVTVDKPEFDYTKNVVEGTPILENGVWKQIWVVSDASAQEIAERKAQKAAENESQRFYDYRNESDPLFFKWQRGEATEQQWLAKVAEIKSRYQD